MNIIGAIEVNKDTYQPPYLLPITFLASEIIVIS